jgi:hypothetical protein
MVLYNLLPSEGPIIEKTPKTLSAERGVCAVLVGAFRAPLALALHGAPPLSVKGLVFVW